MVHLRRQVRERALVIKLSLVDQTKLARAASELARNNNKYVGGEVLLERLDDGMRVGVALLFIDGGEWQYMSPNVDVNFFTPLPTDFQYTAPAMAATIHCSQLLEMIQMAAMGCGFNWWSQHSNRSAFSMR